MSSTARKTLQNVDLEELAQLTEQIERYTLVLRATSPDMAQRICSQSAKMRGLVTKLDGYLKGFGPRKRCAQEHRPVLTPEPNAWRETDR